MVGFFGSLYASTSGLNAQSQSTGFISQNIANLNTIGYKRSEAAFSDIVTSFGRLTDSNTGGVFTTRLQRVSQQGTIQQTSSSTDAAITGEGFFVVRQSPAATVDDAVLYTRNGQFGEDANGFLRNSAGYFLYGIALDQTGTAPTVPTDPTSLVPVQVNIFQTTVLATTQAEIAVNLDANQTDYDPHRFAPSSQLPITGREAHFSRSIGVFDTLGNPQNINLEYRKIVGPMAHFGGNVNIQMDINTQMVPGGSGPLSGINNGDTFDIIVGGVTETYTFVDIATGDDPALNQIATGEGLLNAIEAHGGGSEIEARFNDQGQLLVQAVDPTAIIELQENGPGTPLSGANTLNIIPDPDAVPDFIFEPDADLAGGTYPDQPGFPAFDNLTNPNTQGWWELTITTVDPDDPSLTQVLSQGLLNFDGTGSLNTPVDAFGVPVDGSINLDAINFTNTPTDVDGNPLAAGAEDASIVLDISRTSQLSGPYNVVFSDQNGAGIGTQTGVEIDRDGIVYARFSNGQTSAIYQVPLATFNNPNGLQDISGTAFTETGDSGEVFLSLAGTQGAGTLSTSRLENSNVDLSNEFALLITTQRAFGTNSRVIQTVDEILENLTNLVR